MFLSHNIAGSEVNEGIYGQRSRGEHTTVVAHVKLGIALSQPITGTLI